MKIGWVCMWLFLIALNVLALLNGGSQLFNGFALGLVVAMLANEILGRTLYGPR